MVVDVYSDVDLLIHANSIQFILIQILALILMWISMVILMFGQLHALRSRGTKCTFHLFQRCSKDVCACASPGKCFENRKTN